jgi:hypothetical protein
MALRLFERLDMTQEIIHYNGKRILLVENGVGEKSSSDEDYPIVIFDKRISSWVGGARQLESGSYEGFVACGMHALGVSSDSVRDFASDVYAAILEAEKY